MHRQQNLKANLEAYIILNARLNSLNELFSFSIKLNLFLQIQKQDLESNKCSKNRRHATLPTALTQVQLNF